MAVTLHTNKGDLKLEVYCDQTPVSAKNFLALCASGYYNGVKFHRNIPGFMIQGGDPTGTGKKGESAYGGKLDDEIVDTLKHDRRGVVAFANSGPNTNGSQFYITYAECPHLNNISTIFGRVLHGWEALKTMESVDVDEKYKPKSEIRITSVTIHANPFADIES
eukprot:25546_1